MPLPDDKFWEDEQEELFLLLIGLFLLVSYYAELGAVDMIENPIAIGELSLLTNEIINEYRDKAVGITSYTRERVEAAWEEAGGDVDEFNKLTESIYSKNRASLIGITETTAIFTAISAAVFVAAGNSLVWRTMNDGRVCVECNSMNGKVVSEKNGPPLHPGCRCYLGPHEKE